MNRVYARIIIALLVCCIYGTANANVSVTAGSGGTNICSNKAVTGSAPAFTTLSPLIITEVANSDFSIGTAVIILNAPTGWQFNTTGPTVTYVTGSNITGVSSTITSTSLTVNVTVVNNNGADQVTITGLQVQPTTTSAASGAIRASVASGVAGIATGASGTNFASLSVAAPATATVSISASPSGSFCPGTNITYTPTSTNGGTPTYTWSLNGTDVSIGTTYSNNTLSTGNTISCRMLSSLTCLTGNPVTSNTITTTVLTAPAAISGTNSVCPTTTTALSTSTTGGTWSSSNTAVGTVSATGIVTGVTAGTTNISYMVSGCAATKTVYVNNPPFAPVLTPTVSAICNNTSIAITAGGAPASSTILSQNFNSGLGTWTVDTIGSIGIVPGAEWKACADSYLNEQGWYRSPDHSVFVMANADTSGSSSTLSAKLISPSFSLAEYSAATLSFQHAYDYWPAGDVYVNLDISTNGGSSWTTINNFTGATVGAKMSFASQSYSLNAFLGYSNVKIRFYYKSTFGYYWAIDNVVITGTPGVVTPTWSPVTHLYTNSALTTPYTAGTAINTVYVYPTTVTVPTTIVYTVTATTGACTGSSTSTVTVNPEPGSTSGSLNVCPGTTTTLSNTAAGGTWVSSNPSIATVGSASGIVTGVAVGTVTISYISGSSCATLSVVTVNSAPAAIAGNLNVCMGYTSTLTDATTGGTWSSSNSSVASVGSATGIVSSVAYGTARITYSLGAGCTSTAVVTVQPLPASPSGPMVVCGTQSVTLTDATSGGIWVSGSAGIATVNSTTGVVTGVGGGTVNISYVLPSTGCFSIAVMTVNPLGPITGSGNACLGYTLALGNVAAGGTWVSGNTSVATIDAAGLLTPITTGTTNITYTLSTGCIANKVITVNTLPADVAGAVTVCVSGNTTLTCPTTGGTWSSSNTAIAGVGSSSGIVSGAGAGTVVITYTAATGCFKTYTMTVNPGPAAITGTAVVCAGLTTALSNATSGGTWSTSNAGVASVIAGTVTGESAGAAVITYTLPTGCYGTRGVTVNPLPAAITGALAVCQGLNSALSSSTTGGTWASGNTAVATINSSASVLGVIAGTSTITYTLSTGCITTAIATVNSVPAAISGSGTVCTGASVTVTTGSTGGTWSSSNTSLATVGTSGSVTGVAAGNPVITYTLATSCYATKQMTVYATPAAITGTASVCQDLQTTLSSATSGGVWSSSNTGVATVGTGTGVVAGVVAGTVVITYMVPTGCFDTIIATVLPLPASITGNLSICLGSSSALGNVTTGGTWSSSNAGIADVGSSTGILTGAGLGMATVSYTLPTGCYATTIAVVNPLPSAITGASAVCVNSSTLYINPTTGGSWSSSNTGIAMVGSGTGVVTGMAAGTVVISYILPTGCPATKVITVNPLPSAITGPNNICQASLATLTSAGGTGGTWTSSTLTIATIGPGTGSMFGVNGGSTTITYTLPTGCYVTMAVTVTSLPEPVTGLSSLCATGSILLSDATTGGTWVSGTPSVATVNSLGLVSGISAGTSIVSYVLPIGCTATKTITVNPLPADITGTTALCLGVPVTLGNTTPGGSWSSSNSAMVNAGSLTGIVTGFAYGSVTITYALPTGCNVTTVVTVNLTPSAISGANAVCAGAMTPFTNGVSGGTWSSSNSLVASVVSAGVVTGVAAGTANITYSLSTGCFVVKTITVNPLPASISGPPAICQGLSATLTSATGGGTWGSSNTVVASIGSSSGMVFGTAAGTANITYMLTTGCIATTVLTVHALPGALTGSGNACVGTTTTLSTSTGGGTWSSTDLSVATIDAVGVVSGISTGTSVISYILGVGCSVTRTVTVNPLPPAITGSTPTCVGINIGLSNATPGGTWSSTTSPGVATVNITSGIVTPVTPGTATITYTIGTGCYSTVVVIVNTVMPITGNVGLCAGAISVLGHSTTGGTWSSGNTAVAGIGSASGMAVGYSPGTSVISYAIPGGCIATRVLTVTALPSTISGPASVCPGFTITLGNTTPGGTWSSTNSSIATVSSSTGLVTGVTPGTVSISYNMSSGCGVAKSVTVNPLPAAITGTGNICVGSSTTLTSGVSGGTWSSSNAPVATVGSLSGIVNGISPGTSVITYTPSTGCIATIIVTVNGLPAAIAGNTSICAGTMSVLTNPVSGGTWSSTNTATATITAAGLVSAIAAGTTTISYTSGIGCAVTTVVTVNNMPTPITGVSSACVGFTTNLYSTPSGGAWISANTSIATVNSTTGLVTGVGAGTAIVSYEFSSGCKVQAVVTVSASASVVSGPGTVCNGSSITLTDPALAGGTWSSGNLSVATVGSATGIVTGTGAGTSAITYTIGAGCLTTKIVTVNAVPAAITGVPSSCIGMTTTLNSTTAGGVWSSSNAGIGSVPPGPGIVSGISAGTVHISYTLSNGCFATQLVSVNPMPGIIIGGNTVCAGLTTTLTNLVPGGIWSSGVPGVASVSSAGVVTGLSAGTSMISYLLGAGCMATMAVSVHPLPLPISGTMNVCQGLTATLSSATGGGIWSSGSPAIAGIDAGGTVTAMSPGTSSVTYTMSTGCITTTNVTVHPLAPNTGTPNTCIGLATTLANTVSGGTWSSSDIAVATVLAGTGTVSGMSAGTAYITYTLASGCTSLMLVTVSAVVPTTGSSSVCVGQAIALSNTVPSGTWTSGNALVASVGPSGIVTGLNAGAAMISYSYSGGCIAMKLVSVNPLSPILGTASVCAGQTILLTDATPGGTWSSDVAAVGTISTAGLVSGISAGTTTISYQLGTGCITTRIVTVNPIAAIAGTGNLCIGTITPLSNSTPGGTWSSSSVSVASIGLSSGNASGISAGVATISYILGTGCYATLPVTVNPLPAPITGVANACLYATTTLDNITPGGTWNSSSTIASVDASGVVTGLNAGVALISYILPTGCFRVLPVTINALPSSITGSLQVCEGLSTTLSNSIAGGTWASGSPGVAAIDVTTGLLTGVVPGTAVITYTVGTGCAASVVVTVNSLPATITGSANLCVGTTITLSNLSAGGMWSSTDPTVSVTASTGMVTGVGPGAALITYTLPTGCVSIMPVTVNSLPSAIAGATQVCAGASTILSNLTPDGTWSVSAVSLAGIDAATGIVSGISAGVVVLSYTVATGCYATHTMTINELPAGITGTSSVCQGLTTMLSSATAGGVWSSGSLSVATVSSSGVVGGVAAGVATITYTLPTGCLAGRSVTVNPLPAAISGAGIVCAGQAVNWTSATPGGIWISDATSIAMAASSTGVITGVAPGSATITYSLATGCMRTAVVSVNLTPAPITGPSQMCAGFSVSLGNSTPGGVWSSGTPGVATVSSTGTSNGLIAGTSVISYSLVTGCRATLVMTVNPVPPSITGAAGICPGITINLSNALTGGSWTTAATGIVSVDAASGAVTGITTGVAVITYLMPTGCFTNAVVVVSSPPAAVLGMASACQGATATLTDATSGGTWVSASTGIATVGATTGIVYGASAGTVNISYVLPTGCVATRVFTVYPLPPAITGPPMACLGATTNLANAVPGGTWTSGDITVATIGATTGVVTGLSLGPATITYTLPTGCRISTAVMVQPPPSAITGATHICQGASSLLSSATAGGTWTSVSTSLAIIGSSSGAVSGVAAGATAISYILATGCYAVTVVSVDPLLPIVGSSSICTGDTVYYSNGVPGGVWSSSTTGVATVSSVGMVYATASGVAIISYSLSSGCLATRAVTVNQLPVTFLVTGGGAFCVGSPGAPVGLNGSVPGIGYQLYNGTTALSVITGTGASLNYGLHTVGGSYTVRAINLATGCSRMMLGSAVVAPVALGPAGVSIATTTGDTICNGTTVTFTPVPYLGGSTPTYHWLVNGVSAGSASSYSYVPAAGDIVTCNLTSSASCAVPNTASSSRTMTVLPMVLPSVHADAVPGETVCQLSAVTYNVTHVNGGTTPVFLWLRNGIFVDTGLSWSYAPADGDIITCRMASNARCRTIDTALSNVIDMTVLPYAVPSVTINASPGVAIAPGKEVTFSAVVANAGVMPAYQWSINSAVIAGATNSSFTWSTFTDMDTVSCAVTSSGQCGGITTAGRTVMNVSNVGVAGVGNGAGYLVLLPNPNTGDFTIKGMMPASGPVSIRINDMLGQSVYNEVINTKNGLINAPVSTGNRLANGMYLLYVHTPRGDHIFHFVVRR